MGGRQFFYRIDQPGWWCELEVSSRDEDMIYTDIQFFDERTAYIAGEFGSLLKTRDAGATWESMPIMPMSFIHRACILKI